MSFRNATGSTVTLSGFTAEILDISGPSAKRDTIDTSHMGSVDVRTFIPKALMDWGEVKLEVAFDGEIPTFSTSTSACSIKWGSGNGAKTWTFDCFVTGFDVKAPLEDKMTASLTLKIAGKPTSA